MTGREVMTLPCGAVTWRGATLAAHSEVLEGYPDLEREEIQQAIESAAPA